MISASWITFSRFAWLRISRLYPLYILTTIVVIAGQTVYAHLAGSSFIYPYSTPVSSLVNAFFIQGWGFAPDWYINGPSWSVSVEILVYITFFAYCRSFQQRNAVHLVVGVALGLLFSYVDVQIGRGVAEFYSGGIVALCFANGAPRFVHRRILFACAVTVAVGWSLTIAELWTGLLHGTLQLVVQTLGLHIGAKPIDVLLSLPVRLILIPLTLFSIVIHEKLGSKFYTKVSAVGDITYSSYLIHFPLSLAIAIIDAAGLLDASLVVSWASMLAFFIVLIGMSIWAYKSIEMPAQSYLRGVSATAFAQGWRKPFGLI